MKNAKIWLLIGVVVLLTAGVISKAKVAPSTETAPQIREALPTFSQAILKYGSTGEDVYELQGRLKHLGFYHGKIDSVFGTKTKNAVKWFQSEFGMKVDGIVGPKVKLRLYNATKDWRPTEPKLHEPGRGTTGAAGKGKQGAQLSSANTMGLSDNDLKIMANAVFGEARGEPFEGQVAVAAVILNRVKSPSFPNTPNGVIFQPRAFTAVADGQIWLEPNETAKKAVLQALNGWDPTGGCLYYFNPRTATSEWIWTRPQVKTIGQHIFCM
ncbi:spore cortex-lytic enzyme [Paenibacillus sp. DMB20]|uniref:spore cortex-lytic enzyme n=1 Tax=Paenibacillus sp. DMB20 TaxID=1642570 RepID=UPI000627E28F|nr:spore cortex-lytic enzyme [Paenibacillus sp. DMB20]KKO53313.1 amidase [Paenibacillus sp. DMB20]